MRKSTINFLSIGFFIIATITVSCKTEEGDWNKALESNKSTAFEKFMKDYPQSIHLLEAQKKHAELLKQETWTRTSTSPYFIDYIIFLKENKFDSLNPEQIKVVKNFLSGKISSGLTSEYLLDSLSIVDNALPFDSLNFDPLSLNTLAFQALGKNYALRLINLAIIEAGDEEIDEFITMRMTEYGPYHQEIQRGDDYPMEKVLQENKIIIEVSLGIRKKQLVPF